MLSVSMVLDARTPHCCISKEIPILEVLKAKHQCTSFKITLPVTGTEMKVTRWGSLTSQHFILHVQGEIHIIKELGLEVKFTEAAEAVEMATLDLDIAKTALKEDLK